VILIGSRNWFAKNGGDWIGGWHSRYRNRRTAYLHAREGSTGPLERGVRRPGVTADPVTQCLCPD